MPEGTVKYRAEIASKGVRKVDDPHRIKDEHNEHNHMVEGLSDDMQGFYTELSAIFPEIRVTSGKRTGGDHFSHHHEGDAIDIGREHTDVFEYLTNTKEGLSLMYKYNLGILDETDPRNMEKTGATGPHFHIGKDRGLYSTTKTRYEQFDSIQPLQSFYSQNPNFDYSTPDNLDNANLDLYGSKGESSVYFDGPGPNGEVVPFRLIMPNQQVGEVFKAEIQKEEKKEEIKEEKLQESDHRKLLEQKQKEEQEKVQKVISTMEQIRQRDTESSKREKTSGNYDLQQPPQQQVEIQQTLPKLPTIFKM